MTAGAAGGCATRCWPSRGTLSSASDRAGAAGRGGGSTWTASRRLGVQELKDVETAIAWLTKNPYVDPGRIGMSGHSYGGFRTPTVLHKAPALCRSVSG